MNNVEKLLSYEEQIAMINAAYEDCKYEMAEIKKWYSRSVWQKIKDWFNSFEIVITF